MIQEARRVVELKSGREVEVVRPVEEPAYFRYTDGQRIVYLDDAKEVMNIVSLIGAPESFLRLLGLSKEEPDGEE